MKVILISLLLFAATLVKAEPAVNYEQQIVSLALITEPPSLDSSTAEDQVSAQILNSTNEGLVRLDVEGNLVAGVAERWELDGITAVFHLRENARWADGSAVTAHDFEYAFKRLFDPATGASGSAFYAFVFKNALDVLAGKRPPEELGVRAIDDRTLQITLSRPIPYLLEVLLGTPYLPLKQSFVEAQDGKFGADASRLLSNGPYILSDWQHSASVKLKANPHYWNAEAHHLSAINYNYITSDIRALLNVFKSEELATLTLDDTTMKDASNARLKIRQARTSCMDMLTLNHRAERPTSNRNLRLALQATFDADVYVRQVIGTPANRPTWSVFTSHNQGVKRRFPREYPPRRPELSADKARTYMALARDELGGEIPPLVLLANEGQDKRVEYLQGLFANQLGLDVKIDKQTFKQAIAKLINGDFDLAQSGFCSGTLRDPAYIAGLFESTGTYNDGRFNNAEYDALLEKTRSTLDPKIRMDAFGQMQQILIDEVAVLPTRETGLIFVQHDRLTDVRRYPLVSFSAARVLAP